MALVLSLRRDESFFVDDTKIELVENTTSKSFVLRRPDGVEFPCVDDKMVEILPDVFVGAGRQPSHDQDRVFWARVVIDAPRSVKILREAVRGR